MKCHIIVVIKNRVEVMEKELDQAIKIESSEQSEVIKGEMAPSRGSLT